MHLIKDLKSIKERDPAARNCLEVFFLYSGFHALVYYRIAHFFYKHKLKFIARWISQTGRFFTGVEIHPGAVIGSGLFIDHGSGVVIGETAVIGDNCTIYQGVTLGGTGKDVGKRHPTIGNNVMIGAGAKVLGPFTVGDNAKIAAGAVVLREVPAGATAVGVPARIIFSGRQKEKEQKDSDLDQINIPDPVASEITKMKDTISALENRLSELEN
ncbi:MAG: serine O-acetyltransferase, partial [Clostridia bacterium]|nr:serine O-acetyltransferase [Clostridia bacterium]